MEIVKTELDKKDSVYSVTSKIIYKLTNAVETSSGKAMLASLRNSIGKSLSDSFDVWPLVFENLPEEFLGNGKNTSNEEKAILATLQIFALYQQGKSSSLVSNDDQTGFSNLGTSLSFIRDENNQSSLDRRFNVLITSTTYEELLHHLRQMVKLLKSKANGNVRINFSKLSQDLYWFLKGEEESIRLNWSREYYKSRTREEKGEKKNDEN